MLVLPAGLARASAVARQSPTSPARSSPNETVFVARPLSVIADSRARIVATGSRRSRFQLIALYDRSRCASLTIIGRCFLLRQGRELGAWYAPRIPTEYR